VEKEAKEKRETGLKIIKTSYFNKYSPSNTPSSATDSVPE